MKKLFLSLILITALLLASCNSPPSENNDNNPQGDNTDISSQATKETAATTEEIKPDIPDDVNMQGKTFTLMATNYYEYHPLDLTDLSVEALTGEPLNDAAYNRNIEIESKFNCTVKTVTFPQQDPAMASLRKAVNAGDNVYDIVTVRSINLLSVVTSGQLVDIEKIPYLNTEKPWWDKPVIDATAVLKKNFALCGDITIGRLLTTFNVYFNKKMVKDYQLGDIYGLVKSGKWTMDKLNEMGKAVAADVDGNDIYDEKDRYGATHLLDTVTALLNSFGEQYADVDSSGVPQITFDSEKSMEKYIYITELLSDHMTYFNAHKRVSKANEYEAQMFVRDQTLFSLGGIYYAPEMREMDSDFGIIPFPKYTEEQDKYYTPMTVIAIPFVSVPITNSDLENTGIFLEEYAYLGYKTIRPQFAETLLQRKVARDEESLEMLDLIFNNLIVDIGSLFNFGSIMTSLNENGSTDKRDIASFMEKNSTRIQKDIDKLVATMQENS